MAKQTRINRIVEIVKEKKGESIKVLSSQLGVTETTIRRDLEPLKASGLIKMVSGAVVYNGDVPQTSNSEPSNLERYDLAIQTSKRTTEKYRIAKAAASLIEPDDVIFIDIGSTTANIIQHISSAQPVVTVCCTKNALLEIHKRGLTDIILIGGTYRSDVELFESKEGVELLSRTRISKAFISAAGVNASLGITCINNCEVDTKQAAMQCALEKILVVDSSKFDMVKPAFFAQLDNFTAIVTDDEISEEWRERIEALGIQLYVV